MIVKAMSGNKEKSKNNTTKKEKTSHIKEKKTSATTSGRAILRSTDSEALDAATVKTKTEKAEKVEEIVMSEREKPQKTEAKLKAKTDWEKEKKLSIKSVIDRELDKEEKEGRLKVRPVKKKKASQDKTKSKKVLKERQEGFEKDLKKRPEIKKVIELSEGITIKKLSEKINVPSHEIIELLFNMGEVVNINQSLSRDLIEFLSQEYNFKYHIVGFDDRLDEVYEDAEEELKPRPPIVTVMGHVDHGKTTLLDVIRETNVAISEHGGITQRIGAYQVEYKNRKITFIDTPGHEAFTSIRARGARVTDIAVIVIAANDGIMPQTVEAINHAKEAGVPIIIAINKIDLPDADPEKIKKGLTEYDLVPEEWGGDTICIEISAKKKINLEEFLEMILLVADLNEIKGNPDSMGTGIIIESRLDKSMGPAGTVIVKRGKIKVGDSFITGNSFGRVRSIRDEYGNSIKEAILSQPVEITGFPSVPKAGDKLFVVKDEKSAKELLQRKEYERKMMKIADSRRTLTLEKLSELSKENELIKLKIILKADSQGSLDALVKSLDDIKEEKVKIEIIHKAIGAITESDIMLAVASNAIVIGFGVSLTRSAEQLYKKEGVEVRTYDIIYKLIDDITLAFKGLLKPEVKKVSKGKAEVRETFKLPKVGVIAGSYILEGEVERGNLVNVIRDGNVIFEGKIATLHRFKEDVKKVTSGYECGIRIENFQDINIGDMLEFFEEK
ncbi:MAG: translation initiation factor IF-2 [Candidatus Humimicrobiaceae bacterium]|nr:translation initiation factor IF-2 [Actinomycetota bacterium]MDD5600585.1 translation initiation factor IF-2 [Actinomycetota bacterium]MDY0027501.1 translation initiation factor IF-2 [Candidatus Humimicrobiaceae bacterium]